MQAKLSTARSQLTEASNIVARIRIGKSIDDNGKSTGTPDDARSDFTEADAEAINAEIKAIESQIDALRRKLFDAEV